MSFVLGHALSMKAIHGGQAKHDKSDAHKSAGLLRGGTLPQAYVYPAKMRATRDLLRRRMPLVRPRAALLAHVQQTHSQYTLPALSKHMAYTAQRDGLVERLAAPAVQKNIAVDLALIGYDDPLLNDVELSIVRLAKQHAPATVYRRQSVPGIGPLLSRGLLYASHDSRRCPRGHDCLSSCRLVKGTKTSAGKPYGTSGAKSGNASLQWAFSAAAVLFLRDHPAGHKSLTTLENPHGQGKALTLLAQKLARAVSDRCTRHTEFYMYQFLQA